MTDRTTTTDFETEKPGFGSKRPGFDEQQDMQQQREGMTARAIERQTAKLPSDFFLWASVASMGCSLAYKMMGRDSLALFVGQWAPTFLILGVYNKLVKVAGSDRMTATGSNVYMP